MPHQSYNYSYNPHLLRTVEQRMALYKEKQKIEQAKKIRPAVKLKQKTTKAKEVKQQQKPLKVNLLERQVDPLLKSLLDKLAYDDSLLPVKKKKKKKGQDKSQGLGL